MSSTLLQNWRFMRPFLLKTSSTLTVTYIGYNIKMGTNTHVESWGLLLIMYHGQVLCINTGSTILHSNKIRIIRKYVFTEVQLKLYWGDFALPLRTCSTSIYNGYNSFYYHSFMCPLLILSVFHFSTVYLITVIFILLIVLRNISGSAHKSDHNITYAFCDAYTFQLTVYIIGILHTSG